MHTIERLEYNEVTKQYGMESIHCQHIGLYDQLNTIDQSFMNLVASKAMKLADDWMRDNPNKGRPRLIVRWPDGKLLIDDVVIMIDPSDEFVFA